MQVFGHIEMRIFLSVITWWDNVIPLHKKVKSGYTEENFIEQDTSQKSAYPLENQ